MNQRKIAFLLAATLATLLPVTKTACADAEATIDVHVDQPLVELSPVLYGLFFEDINYSADGGLYAELVQNRSFEYYPVGGWGVDSGRKMHPLYAWQKVERDGGSAKLAVVDEKPLNTNNTRYLQMRLGDEGAAGVQNRGFDGIVIDEGATYDFSVYARRQGGDAPLTVAIEDADGKVLASGEVRGVGADWKKHELVLTASGSADKATLSITSVGGELMLDMVSLFPQDTFKGRKNGLRKDLAQALADLEPGFLRFPGGCIVHGEGLANAYRWKDTVGDVAERKPNRNLWGYHQTYGLGYFEYFQLCEDIGAAPLPVLPVGVACGFRRPFDVVPMDDLGEWVQDALDLIEFANGPADSKWGRFRAEMGHPEPFGLEYLCLGNEEHDTREARQRFPYFVKAVREKHPEIKIIGTSGLGPEIPLYDLMARLDVYSTDEHYYLSPDWYLTNDDRFDRFDRNLPKVFVGEYASEGNTQRNAVAEAAWLTGVERNADIVDMTCYAPLFAKYDWTQWTLANLIWFNNKEVVRTPNYWVQQLFSRNKGDAYVRNTVENTPGDWAGNSFAGGVGVGTWRTTIEVERATLNGEPLDLTEWDARGGSFSPDGDRLVQEDPHSEGGVALAPVAVEEPTAVFEVRARKTGGDEGFLIVFGDDRGENRYWWNVGGWGNTAHGIERRVGSNSVEQLARQGGNIETGRWYDLRVELAPGSIKCFLDGELVHHHQEQPPRVYASPTIDNASGELALKIVNPATYSVSVKINLQGAAKLAPEAELATLAGPANAVNSPQSTEIKPIVSRVQAADTMELELPPMSVQVLRVGVK